MDLASAAPVGVATAVTDAPTRLAVSADARASGNISATPTRTYQLLNQPRRRPPVRRIVACEVTVAMFRRFVEETRYRTEGEQDGRGAMFSDQVTGERSQRPDMTWQKPDFPQTDEHPVSIVSWNDAAAFCRWLSDKEKKPYRLPTEAEWEFACRAGSADRYCCGNDLVAIRDCAWSGEGPHATSHRVAQKKANAFGLFDMHGNVWEWCADWYQPRYDRSLSATIDPRGPASSRTKVMRGGAYEYHDLYARSANRAFAAPSRRTLNLGFRVVMPVRSPRSDPKL